jgi:hypothetical protein
MMIAVRRVLHERERGSAIPHVNEAKFLVSTA